MDLPGGLRLVILKSDFSGPMVDVEEKGAGDRDGDEGADGFKGAAAAG